MSKRAILTIIFFILIIIVVFWLTETKYQTQLPQSAQQQPTQTKQSQPKSKNQTIPFPLSVKQGFVASLFATDVPNARDIQFSPSGSLLVSSPGTGRVYALQDRNNDGVVNVKKVILSGLNQPHGLAFYQGKLFVAEVTRVARYSWNERSQTATLEKVLFSLPQSGNHNKRTLLFDRKGNLYISVGSTCNVCEERDSRSGTIMISESDGNNPRIFAQGLRNAPFMTLKPGTDTLWVTEMGRDHLGDNLPPDEINIVRDGKHYGWPYCYGDRVFDRNFNRKSSSFCASTIPPIYQIPAHSAPLGLVFIPQEFSSSLAGNLLVAYHGSWNRSVPTGYKVVLLSVSGETVASSEDFITGFQNDGQVVGRPVDITFDKSGRAYISDDKAGNIYLVTANN